MIGLSAKLSAYESANGPIGVSIIGAGQMGKSLLAQMRLIRGMRLRVLYNRTKDTMLAALRSAGYSEKDYIVTDDMQKAHAAPGDAIIATQNREIATGLGNVDCVVEATGVPSLGAWVAMDAIANKKHIVMMNVETDVALGHLFYRKARENGVVYTGTAGDEPGAVMELYEMATAIGLNVLCIGKGKNNPIDYDCTPKSVEHIARVKRASPRMIASFMDGTKTMVEMTAMANATGFTPDIPGGHGASAAINEVASVMRLKSEGGILNNYGVVDYINGIAPGVFIVVTTPQPEALDIFRYLAMGEGPNYTLYRPFHLTSLETPITIARAVIDKQPTIVPTFGRIAQTITLAKRDLAPGDMLDGIGGYSVRGQFISQKDVGDALPIGLIDENTRVTRPVKRGEPVRFGDVDMPDSLVLSLYREQEQMLSAAR